MTPLSNQNLWKPRPAAAILCLLAVVLLQAPFASAAWLSSSMACCMADHCPVESHHHKPAAESDMPMDCGHHSSKVSECKMSCCKSTDDTAINVALFLLPEPQSVSGMEPATPWASQYALQLLSRSEKPQSPPPRTILA